MITPEAYSPKTTINISKPVIFVVEPDEDYIISLKFEVAEDFVDFYLNFNPKIPSYDKNAEFNFKIADELSLDPIVWKKLGLYGAFIFIDVDSHLEASIELTYEVQIHRRVPLWKYLFEQIKIPLVSLLPLGLSIYVLNKFHALLSQAPKRDEVKE